MKLLIEQNTKQKPGEKHKLRNARKGNKLWSSEKTLKVRCMNQSAVGQGGQKKLQTKQNWELFAKKKMLKSY